MGADEFAVVLLQDVGLISLEAGPDAVLLADGGESPPRTNRAMAASMRSTIGWNGASPVLPASMSLISSPLAEA
ncbi:hypothetical protein [Verrucomicrobium spinosum]|uniref:hypothetical protein n=1 Tax=Verrucomicrobium spinosum TaxID=2736 RepID=UPI00210890CA|nr:hypothetical protein [Verrucomicrobium spinosum]